MERASLTRPVDPGGFFVGKGEEVNLQELLVQKRILEELMIKLINSFCTFIFRARGATPAEQIPPRIPLSGKNWAIDEGSQG
jgi:hypothetical protein